MSKLYKSLVIILFATLFTGLNNTAEASHTAGMDLIYRHISGNQYELIFRFYRDCKGTSAPSSVSICAESKSCGAVTTFSLPKTSTSSGSIPLPCTKNAGGTNDPCTNSSATGFGFEEHIYRKIVNIPQKCSDWIFSYSLCCRPAAVDNIAYDDQYIEAMLNNLDAPGNSSPHFHDITDFPATSPYYLNNFPIRTVCPGNQYNFVQSVKDLDGDSIVYSLYNVQAGSFGCPQTPTNIAYIAPYTPKKPVPYDNSFGFNFNTQQGIISFVPQKIAGEETYMLGIKAEEYRNDTIFDGSGNIVGINPVKIGMVKRDMTIIVNDTVNCVKDTIKSVGGNPSGPNGAVDPATGLPVYYANCATDHINYYLANSVQCFTVEPNGTDFVLLDTTSKKKPTNPPNTIASAVPMGGCIGGATDSIRLNFYSPLDTGAYYVIIRPGMDQNTLISECGIQVDPFIDTLLIIVDDEAAVNLSTSNNNICIPSDSYPVLNSGINSNNGDYIWTYHGDPWSSTINDTLDSGSNNTHIADTTGWYKVFVEVGSGCKGTDSIQITIGQDPVLDLDSSMNICPSALGSTVFDAGVTGSNISYTWFFDDGSGPIQIGSNQTQQAIDEGSYYLKVSNGNCVSRDTIELIITNELIVELVDDSYHICETDGEVTFDTDQSIINDFKWTHDGTNLGIDEPTITVSDPGTYEVTMTASNGCTGTATGVLKVDSLPPAPIVYCSIQDDETVEFYWDEISGATDYEVSEDDGNTWIAPNGSNKLTHETSTEIQFIHVRAINANNQCRTGYTGTSEECESEITLPNVISPNGDGINDKLVIDFLDLYPGSRLIIFDRWGGKIYDQEYDGNESTAWDGEGHSDGTYYVVLKISDGRTINQTITLIK